MAKKLIFELCHKKCLARKKLVFNICINFKILTLQFLMVKSLKKTSVDLIMKINS